jgi:low affinity Fe/Cu permease
MEKDIVQQKVWNTKQVVTIVAVAISVTFSVTMIWGRFLFMETKMADLDTKIEYVNNRIDTKTARNKEDIDKNTKDIETLKLPNSDNE